MYKKWWRQSNPESRSPPYLVEYCPDSCGVCGVVVCMVWCDKRIFFQTFSFKHLLRFLIFSYNFNLPLKTILKYHVALIIGFFSSNFLIPHKVESSGELQYVIWKCVSTKNLFYVCDWASPGETIQWEESAQRTNIQLCLLLFL